MRVDWALLANAAEVRDGLCYILGGGFDTVNVASVPTRLFGTVVIRFALTTTETRRPHQIEIVTLDEDGKDVARIQGEVSVDRAEIPLGWDQGVIFAFRLNGLPLADYGLYRMDILADGRMEHQLNFRVIRIPEQKPPDSG